MRVDVVLNYGGLLFTFSPEEEYDTLAAAQFDWSLGPYSCDCERSQWLRRCGAIDTTLPCNPDKNQILLWDLRPFQVH